MLGEHIKAGCYKSRDMSMTRIFVDRPLQVASKVAIFGAQFTVTQRCGLMRGGQHIRGLDLDSV